MPPSKFRHNNCSLLCKNILKALSLSPVGSSDSDTLFQEGIIIMNHSKAPNPFFMTFLNCLLHPDSFQETDKTAVKIHHVKHSHITNQLAESTPFFFFYPKGIKIVVYSIFQKAYELKCNLLLINPTGIVKQVCSDITFWLAIISKAAASETCVGYTQKIFLL